jgi:hypothetical protein
VVRVSVSHCGHGFLHRANDYDELKDGALYVSMSFATVAHKCCCGCGKEVVTPLSPTDWKLIFDGKSITLDPSVGNWSFPCKSHYWIRGGKVRWAAEWSQDEIDAGRAKDRLAKERHFETASAEPPASGKKKKRRFLRKFKWW